MPRILAQAVHYPKPEHREDLIAAMKRLAAATEGLAGLDEIGGFEDAADGRIVAISVWSSPEAMQAGMPALGAAIADVPFDEWERQPGTMTFLPQVA
jgi:quinol monooxygenase YgiN